MLAVKIALLPIICFGMAILFGAVTERWVGETVSSWFALAGLWVGIFMLPYVFALF